MAQITLNSSGVASNGSLLLQSNGTTTAVTIDTAQNMGLGVTPSAWGSTWKALNIGSAGNGIAGSTNSGQPFFTSNAYFDGTNWKYGQTGLAGFFTTSSGIHSWHTAASGTAGNTISFTQAMTLDASGNLGIGTSSPAAPFHVSGVNLDTNAFRIVSTTGTNASAGTFRNTGGNFYIGLDNSAGNRIQVSSGAAYAACVWHEGAYPVVFGTSNAERMRIGANGGLAIAQGLGVGTSTVFTSSIFFASAVLSAGAGTYPLRWNSSTGIVTYDTSSRLVKENIEDSPYGLAEVLQLKSRKYHRTDDERDEIGLVADEVQAVMPEFVPLVAKSIFTKDEADTELIAGGVNYDKLTSVLVKAIQEQQAIIQTLTDRITALEQA